MTPVIARRLRITTATIVVLAVATLLCVPNSLLSVVFGYADGHPLPPAPSVLHPVSHDAGSPATQYADPARVDSVHDALEASIQSAMDNVEHHVEGLMGDVLTDDLALELTQIPDSLEDGGLFDGFDFPQDGHLPLFAASNGSSGFPRGGSPFLGGGFRRRGRWIWCRRRWIWCSRWGICGIRW